MARTLSTFVFLVLLSFVSAAAQPTSDSTVTRDEAPDEQAPRRTFIKCFRAPSYMIGVSCADLASNNIFNGSLIPGRGSNRAAMSLSVGIDWFFPFVNPKNELSIGISPGIQGVMGPELYPTSFDESSNGELDGDGFASVIAFPIMVETKLGADAPAQRGSIFGLTVGLGYQPTIFTGDGSYFGLPIAMIEGDLRLGRFIGKLRFTTQIGTVSLSEEVSARMYTVAVGASRTF